MTEPSEWAMEKARKVIEIDGIPDHAPLLQRFARALDEVVTNARAEEREACARGAAVAIATAIRDRGGNNE